MTDLSDTICAPATVPGTGAISIVRVSGPDALHIADSVVTLGSGKKISDAKGYSLHRGTVSDGYDFLDDVLVSVFRAPHSYTGEDGVEISCHASSYIVQRLLQLLIAQGARMAEPGEFTRRAFTAGKLDLAEAEAVADLIASENAAAHRIAVHQLRGGYSDEMRQMRQRLVEIASLMELELDFSEEEVEFADRVELRRLITELSAHIGRLTASFRLGNAIRNGVPVTIAGAVNSGKSTLLNALLGEDRAIVSDIAGTTRDTVEDCLNIGGTLFRFIDTAGIRETGEEIERQGIDRSFSKISGADIVLCVVDPGTGPQAMKDSVRTVLAHCSLQEQKLVILVNKTDLEGAEGMVRFMRSFAAEIDPAIVTLGISAKYGKGLDQLRETLLKLQESRIPSAQTTLVSNARHYEALLHAGEALGRLQDALERRIPTDLAAQDIREASWWIGSVTGEITPDDILSTIFERFCIGK